MNHFNFTHAPSFSLDNFEGPLELLLFLIQKDEMDVCDIAIQKLTTQLIETIDGSNVETHAELMGLAATLLLIKSQRLLPAEEASEEEAVEDPRLQMIEKLIEYCQFRDTATTLLSREEAQKAHFLRAAPLYKKELGTGLEEVGLNDLQQIMQEVMQRAKKQTAHIQDEEWHIAPKMEWLRVAVEGDKRLPFEEVFAEEKCREELIVSFLALLELMKLQELRMIRENNIIYIIAGYEHKSP